MFRRINGRLILYIILGGVAIVFLFPFLQQLLPGLRPSKTLELPQSAQSAGQQEQEKSQSIQIITVLPKDAIRSIDQPQFVSREEASAWMRPDELVIGLSINGDSRAYPINLLSRHEIVNDTVGGMPVAVTW